MNKTIKALNKKLQTKAADAAAIEMELQTAWNKVFDDSDKIKAMVSKVENSDNYTSNKYGEVCSFVWIDLSDFKDCKQYFETYMQDNHCVSIDWTIEALELSHGDDNLMIQRDTRHDNGVWQNHELVIDEAEYLDDDGEVDEAKRNALIETHMEKTGFFPGVFTVDYHGNIFLVNTAVKASA